MATRKIDTQIARDSHWRDMSIRVRYFWFYLLTTDFSKTVGIFHLPLDLVSQETDLEVDEIKQYLMTLTDMHLLLYSPETSEVVIFNYPKYNIFGWDKSLEKQITNELSTIKNLNLIKIISSFIQNYILTRPNDRRSIFLSKVLTCCDKALQPFKEKEKTLDKDKDKDEDKEINGINENINKGDELIVETSNFEDDNWETMQRIIHTRWF